MNTSFFFQVEMMARDKKQTSTWLGGSGLGFVFYRHHCRPAYMSYVVTYIHGVWYRMQGRLAEVYFLSSPFFFRVGSLFLGSQFFCLCQRASTAAVVVYTPRQTANSNIRAQTKSALSATGTPDNVPDERKGGRLYLVSCRAHISYCKIPHLLSSSVGASKRRAVVRIDAR